MSVRLYIVAALLICLLLLAFSIDAQPVRKEGVSSKPINVIKPVKQNNTTNIRQGLGRNRYQIDR